MVLRIHSFATFSEASTKLSPEGSVTPEQLLSYLFGEETQLQGMHTEESSKKITKMIIGSAVFIIIY